MMQKKAQKQQNLISNQSCDDSTIRIMHINQTTPLNMQNAQIKQKLMKKSSSNQISDLKELNTSVSIPIIDLQSYFSKQNRDQHMGEHLFGSNDQKISKHTSNDKQQEIITLLNKMKEKQFIKIHPQYEQRLIKLLTQKTILDRQINEYLEESSIELSDSSQSNSNDNQQSSDEQYEISVQKMQKFMKKRQRNRKCQQLQKKKDYILGQIQKITLKQENKQHYSLDQILNPIERKKSRQKQLNSVQISQNLSKQLTSDLNTSINTEVIQKHLVNQNEFSQLSEQLKYQQIMPINICENNQKKCTDQLNQCGIKTIMFQFNSNEFNNSFMSQIFRYLSQSLKGIFKKHAQDTILQNKIIYTSQKSSKFQKNDESDILSDLNIKKRDKTILKQNQELECDIKQFNTQFQKDDHSSKQQNNNFFKQQKDNFPKQQKEQIYPDVDIRFTDTEGQVKTYHFQSQLFQRLRTIYKQNKWQFNIRIFFKESIEIIQMFNGQKFIQHFLLLFKKVLFGQKHFSQQQNYKDFNQNFSQTHKFSQSTRLSSISDLKFQQTDQQIGEYNKREQILSCQQVIDLDEPITQLPKDLADKVIKYNSLIEMFYGPSDPFSQRFRILSKQQKQQLKIKSNINAYAINFSNFYITKLGLLLFEQQTTWNMVACIQFVKCDINDDMMRTMIQKIDLFPNLRKLNCEQNRISQITKQYLQTMKSKTKLICFNLKNNPLTKKSIDNIQKFMKKNKNIKIQYTKPSPQKKVSDENEIETQKQVIDLELIELIDKLNKSQQAKQSLRLFFNNKS